MVSTNGSVIYCMSEIADKKRLAKNTIYLYIRTLVIMLITLYTSRVVLQKLGVTDFGIYNVIGGLVIMFSFISNAMSTATQRFLSYALGKKEEFEVRRIFSMSLMIYYAIAIIIVFLADTIGLYFLTTQMNFPSNRLTAVYWVYQLSLLSFCLNIIRIPYTASIIAYENMSLYAYISIVENILKLIIVYMLSLFGEDKLIAYSFLMAIVIAITNLFYYVSCKWKFTACRFFLFWDKLLFKKLFSFSSWSMYGSVAVVSSNQGINIVYNIFSGVIVNAAMGIASQVESAISTFVSSFQTAMSPQIVKLYAADQIKEMIHLVFQASRISYCLVFLFGIPLLIFCEPILSLWLGEIPQLAVPFTQLTIVFIMIESLAAPLYYSVQATGKIKVYQIIISSLFFFNLPFAYILMKFGFSPVAVLVLKCLLQIVILSARLIYLYKLINFPLIKYCSEVIFRIIKMNIVATPFSLYTFTHLADLTTNIALLLFIIIQDVAIIYVLGLNKSEREIICDKILSTVKNKF